MKKILSPLSDPVFKRIFGTEKEILIEFINTFVKLENPVVSIEFLPLELLSDSRDEKTSLVDVRCIDEAKRNFIVGIQLSPQKDFRKRALFYLSRVFSRQLGLGENYALLEPVYIISLLDFQLFNEFTDGYHSYSMSREQDLQSTMEGLHLIFIELPKLKKSSNFNPATLQDYWTLFLTQPDKLLNMSARHLHNYPNLLKAVDLLDESKYTREQLAAYDHYLDSIRSYNGAMMFRYDEGFDKGLEKGIEKGREEGMEKGVELGIEIGLEEGRLKGKEESRNHIRNIITELKKAEKSIEEIAVQFNETIEFIVSLKGL